MIYDPRLHELWSTQCASMRRQNFAVASDDRDVVSTNLVIDNQENIEASCIILPDLCAHLIVQEPVDTFRTPRMVLVGPRSKAIVINHHNRSRTTVTRLKPGALTNLAVLEVGEAVNKSVGIKILNEHSYDELRRLLEVGASHDAIFEVMTGMASTWKAKVDSRVWLGLINYCQTRSHRKVREAAQFVGTSERNLRKVCKRQAGLSPHAVLRIVRLTHSLQLIKGNVELGWAHIANASGYYDQSHMIDDYQSLIGESPGALFE